jgi:hypothetical protein
MKHVEVDRRGIMHNGGIMVPGKDVARSSHIGCQLVNLIDTAQYFCGDGYIPKVALDKFIRSRDPEFGMLHVNAANPKALALQPAHQMSADESTGTCN